MSEEKNEKRNVKDLFTNADKKLLKRYAGITVGSLALLGVAIYVAKKGIDADKIAMAVEQAPEVAAEVASATAENAI